MSENYQPFDLQSALREVSTGIQPPANPANPANPLSNQRDMLANRVLIRANQRLIGGESDAGQAADGDGLATFSTRLARVNHLKEKEISTISTISNPLIPWSYGVFLVHPPAVRGRCPACNSVRWGQGLTFRRCLECGFQEGETVAEILAKKGRG
jgi:hypothetical protein